MISRGRGDIGASIIDRMDMREVSRDKHRDTLKFYDLGMT
jgi:hypothetical protein